MAQLPATARAASSEYYGGYGVYYLTGVKDGEATAAAVSFNSTKMLEEGGLLGVAPYLKQNGSSAITYNMTGINPDVFKYQTVAQVRVGSNNGITIGSRAFESLQVKKMVGSPITEHTVTISGGMIKEIGENAFRGIYVDGDCTIQTIAGTVGRHAFQDAVVNGTFMMAGNIERLDDYAFSGLRVKKLRCTGSIKEIGNYAFQDTELDHFTLDPSHEVIGSKIFEGCDQLQTITLPTGNNLRSVAEDAFPNKEGLVIKIPADAADLALFHPEHYTKPIFEVSDTISDDSREIAILKESGVLWRKGADGKLMRGDKPADETPQPETPPVETPAPTPLMTPTAMPTIAPSITPAPTAMPTITPPTTPAATQTPTQTPDPNTDPTMHPTPAAPAAKTDAPPNTPSEPPVTPVNTAAGKGFVHRGLRYRICGKNAVSVTGAVSKKRTAVTIPDVLRKGEQLYQVRQIGKDAFSHMKKLKKVKIGNFVIKIGDRAFANCPKLRQIHFGSRLKTLGKQVLYKDRTLKKIVLRGVHLKAIGKKTFFGVPPKVDIQVPNTKIKKYQKMIRKASKA